LPGDFGMPANRAKCGIEQAQTEGIFVHQVHIVGGCLNGKDQRIAISGF
jgi:hypothetical protein